MASIYTRDLLAACVRRPIKAAWVNINESSNHWEPQLPFGGGQAPSGIGRVGGAHVMHSFTELQTIVLTPDRRADRPSRAGDRRALGALAPGLRARRLTW